MMENVHIWKQCALFLIMETYSKKLHALHKNTLPSLIDVILTNKPKFYSKCINFVINCGLSDYHNIISFQLKGYAPKINLKEFIWYIYEKYSIQMVQKYALFNSLF
jgi:hypothetical protein